MDTNVDIEENQISFTTNHFSEYIIVDISTWKAAWEQESIKIRNKDSKFEIAFVIDDSGSMTSNDGENKRLEATKEFVKELEENDSYSVVKFVDSAEEVLGLTTDKSKLSDALKSFSSSGGTNIGSGLEKGLEVLKENNNNTKVIVLLTDGEDGVATDTKEKVIKEAKDRGITIFAIFLTSSENVASAVKNVDVQEISTSTGGYYYTNESSKMAEVFNRIHHVSVGIDLDGEDSDGDGLPDELELGGIKNQFGQIIYTNPYSDDTDEDGKSDKEEVGNLITDHYEMKSDPNIYNGNISSSSLKHFGPSLKTDSSKVWDSKFNMYKNAFKFKNVNIRLSNGVCAGISFMVEKTYNNEKIAFENDNPQIGDEKMSADEIPDEMQELKQFVEEVECGIICPLSVESVKDYNSEKDIIEKNEPHAFVVDTLEEYNALMSEEFAQQMAGNMCYIFTNKFQGFKVEDTAVKNGLLYFYNPKSKLLKDAKNDYKRIEYNELENNEDKDLLCMLHYYYILYNIQVTSNMDNYDIDYSTPMNEDCLNNLKNTFSSGQVVSIGLPGHMITGYALEEIAENNYNLYVYDNRFPASKGKNLFINIYKSEETKKYEIGNDGFFKKNDKDGEGIDKDGVFKMLIIKDGEILNYPEK